jgi:hypothetical protein
MVQGARAGATGKPVRRAVQFAGPAKEEWACAPGS